MQPKIVGHRGAALVAPENSLRAFRAGAEAAADLLECDVHLSADGRLVVMHDTTIDRTAAEDSPLRTGALAELTRAQIDRVRLADGEPVPSLAEVLDVAQHAGIPMYVEVKAPAAAELTAQMLVDRGMDSGSTWIISFKADALRAARETAPQIPIAYIAHAADENFWPIAAELRAEAVSLQMSKLPDADVLRAHEAGFVLNAWTINDEESLQRAVALGIDTITTDDPGWARGVLAARTDTTV
ncbi:glycerophosphodiester phosphodiesterase [Brachybacterium endophyticum]|uniref:Glycerophosphodiester phosphodiesterase n=1 Tax=Brachybacterium endophyticum TaxID=2182385 RepID=A0A2U2RLM1_9MICO|nr:glycerophosphodiester phosphodiesterase family protein [Brachybacterium endophyticum]PWH06769.1 glycerophosphodiester phosphodiesterase [Brachybacterium endophyticum]